MWAVGLLLALTGCFNQMTPTYSFFLLILRILFYPFYPFSFFPYYFLFYGRQVPFGRSAPVIVNAVRVKAMFR